MKLRRVIHRGGGAPAKFVPAPQTQGPTAVGVLSAVVFAALVLATFGAFFVAQRLKGAPSQLQQLSATRLFSPNADGRKDVARLGFLLTSSATVTIDVVDSGGSPVARVFGPSSVERYRRVRTRWNGTAGDADHRAPDGRYRYLLRRNSSTTTLPLTVTLDATPPAVRLEARTVSRRGRLVAALKLRSPGRRRTLLVFRRVGNVWRSFGARQVLPFGQTNAEVDLHRVPGSTALVVLAARDLAGNVAYSVPWDRRRSAPIRTVRGNASLE